MSNNIKYGEWDGGVARTKWIKREMQRLSFKVMIIRYNQLRLKNNSNKISMEQSQELADIYRVGAPNKELALNATKSLLKMEEVRSYADKQLEEALTEHGITKSFLVGERKKIYTTAMTDKDLKMASQTLDKLDDFAGMKQTVTTTETKSIDYGALANIPSHVEIQQVETVKEVDSKKDGEE